MGVNFLQWKKKKKILWETVRACQPHDNTAGWLTRHQAPGQVCREAALSHSPFQKPARVLWSTGPEGQRSWTLTLPLVSRPRPPTCQTRSLLTEGLCLRPGHFPGKSQALSPPRLTRSTQLVSWHKATAMPSPRPHILAGP